MLCKECVALVTGAAGNGMGRSIALTLAREGAAVIVNYRSNEERAAAIVQHIRNRGGKALAVRADVCRPEDCRALVEAAEGVFGHVDICIINPGAGWHPEPVDRLDAGDALDDVNRELSPLYNLMPLVLPGMYQRGCGRIIGLSLNLSLPSPSYSYDAAKSARTGAFRRAVPEAWQHSVTMNIIAPGRVHPLTRWIKPSNYATGTPPGANGITSLRRISPKTLPGSAPMPGGSSPGANSLIPIVMEADHA